MNGNIDERKTGISGDKIAPTYPNDQPHSFSATNRQTMLIRGVKDVLSFDENGVFLITTCGQLTLEGIGLHVSVLNTRDGIVEVTGKLCSLFYDDSESYTNDTDKHKGKRGFFGRLLS